MLDGVNDELIAGLATVTLSDAGALGFPGPLSFEVTAPVVLFLLPGVVAVTVTLNWHWPFAAIVAPDSAMLPPFVVNVPPQVAVVAFATVRPDGRVSVKPTPVSDVPGLDWVIVNVRDEVWPTGTEVGLNDALMAGGKGVLTVSCAVLTLPLPPSVDVTALVELDLMPGVVPIAV